jgi:hypothetical protein
VAVVILLVGAGALPTWAQSAAQTSTAMHVTLTAEPSVVTLPSAGAPPAEFTLTATFRLDEPLAEGSEGAALRVGSVDGVDLQGVSTMSVVALSPELSDCSPLGPWAEFCRWLAPQTGAEVIIKLRFTLSDTTRVGDHDFIAYGLDIPSNQGLTGDVHTMVTALPAPASPPTPIEIQPTFTG